MNEPLDDQNLTRPACDLDRIDQLCEQFEDACKASQGPQIEEYLEQVPQQDRSALFEQLLPVELHWRRQRGERPAQEEYRDRFAEYTRQIDSAFAFKKGADTPRSADWHTETHAIGARALHVRCPHCRNPIEIVDDTPLAEITCPSCGSSFSLVGDEALAHRTSGGTRRRRQRVGHFELVEQLGAGAFGVVWRARDTKLDRTVAVKIPRKGQLDREETEKFLREARAAAQLRHPNIVSVHEVGIEQDLLYIVSDYVEGLSLHDWRTGHKFGYRESAELCAKIAEALDYAHEQGVVHRDLKPTNVLLDRSGEVHLMDFGLAKREAGEVTMTTEGQILGTPAYMSPEQARGEAHQADRRTDLYSLGVILYELLTGELPFRGNLRMMLKQVLEDNPPSLRKLDGNIPRDLETICLKCMEKDPDRRYPRARELADELRRYLDGKPIHARPVGRMERAWRWCRRNPVVAGLLAAVAVSLVSGIVVSTRFAIAAGRRAIEAQEAEQEGLELANEKTELAAREQAARAEEARQRLLLLQQQALESVRNAWQAFDEGDEPTMLIWLADAYRTSDRVARAAAADPGLDEAAKRQIEWQREVNRMRMASALQHHPLVHVWPGVRAAAFSHDGRLAATGGHEGEVVVYELATGREVHQWKTKDLGGPTEEPTPEAASGPRYPMHAVLRIGFSPDDRLLMTVTPKALQLWDLSTGKGRLFKCDEIVTRACFADEGRAVLACLHDRKLRWWDVGSALAAKELDVDGEVLRFSPDGRRLAVRSAAGEESTTLSILDAASGETLATLQTGPHVGQALFSPDATRLAALRTVPEAPLSSPRLVEIWDIGQGQRTGNGRLYARWRSLPTESDWPRQPPTTRQAAIGLEYWTARPASRSDRSWSTKRLSRIWRFPPTGRCWQWPVAE
jgi:tRNA A-37 threonylcarbamoyl transferase component Bud32/ribosomal protein S27E